MAYNALAIRLRPEVIRSLDNASIMSGYMGVGSALENPSRFIQLKNFTDAEVMVSLDGVNDHIIMAAGEVDVFDVTSNKTINQGLYFAEGTRFYIKYTDSAPTTGSFYVVTLYGSDS